MSKVRRQINFDFETELAAVLRRAERLKAAVAGTATITPVDVKKCMVKAHSRVAHTRYVITIGRRKS